MYIYVELHVHSTLAFRKQKEKKGKVTHPTIAPEKQTRDTWMPSLENWGGGFNMYIDTYYMYQESLLE